MLRNYLPTQIFIAGFIVLFLLGSAVNSFFGLKSDFISIVLFLVFPALNGFFTIYFVKSGEFSDFWKSGFKSSFIFSILAPLPFFFWGVWQVGYNLSAQFKDFYISFIFLFSLSLIGAVIGILVKMITAAQKNKLVHK